MKVSEMKFETFDGREISLREVKSITKFGVEKLLQVVNDDKSKTISDMFETVSKEVDELLAKDDESGVERAKELAATLSSINASSSLAISSLMKERGLSLDDGIMEMMKKEIEAREFDGEILSTEDVCRMGVFKTSADAGVLALKRKSGIAKEGLDLLDKVLSDSEEFIAKIIEKARANPKNSTDELFIISDTVESLAKLNDEMRKKRAREAEVEVINYDELNTVHITKDEINSIAFLSGGIMGLLSINNIKDMNDKVIGRCADLLYKCDGVANVLKEKSERLTLDGDDKKVFDHFLLMFEKLLCFLEDIAIKD